MVCWRMQSPMTRVVFVREASRRAVTSLHTATVWRCVSYAKFDVLELCYSETTVYSGIHERSEFIPL